MTKILAIETSCDETSAAVVEEGPKILSNVIASQIKSHQRFGGVVPEIASRHHVEAISLVIEDALKEAGVTYGDLDAVAVTQGPGLVGSLLVGISAAKTIALAHDLPLITVNHIVGHIYAGQFKQDFVFPALALIVSGGHTELILMRSHTDMEIIGETRDDAVGEAYDKIGRVLGVPYPGGKHIDEMAQRGSDLYDFPRAMIDEDNYDFSFSGLKSAFINKVHNADQRGEDLNKEDLAASFQAASVDVLLAKTLRAAEEYDVKQVILGGGVAANSDLRTSLQAAVENQLGIEVLVPDLNLCGDNAAMIGAAAHVKYADKEFSDLAFNAQPGMEI